MSNTLTAVCVCAAILYGSAAGWKSAYDADIAARYANHSATSLIALSINCRDGVISHDDCTGIQRQAEKVKRVLRYKRHGY